MGTLKSVLDFSHDDKMPEISTYKDKDIFGVGFGVSSPCLVGSVSLSNWSHIHTSWYKCVVIKNKQINKNKTMYVLAKELKKEGTRAPPPPL